MPTWKEEEHAESEEGVVQADLQSDLLIMAAIRTRCNHTAQYICFLLSPARFDHWAPHNFYRSGHGQENTGKETPHS